MTTYIEPVFRPPSEANSLILQITNGCSWNRCTFCEMYTAPQKRFDFKSTGEVAVELQRVAQAGYLVRRVFLADGDAMTLSTRRLLAVLQKIRHFFPDVQRVSSYCLPRNVRHKSVEELAALRQAGLSLLYVGCESGDDAVLERVCKGETFDSSLSALQKITAAGIKSSVMILNGLGGQQLSVQHAQASARLMNETQPDYLSTLVLSFPAGTQRFEAGFGGEFEPLNKSQLFEELALFIEHLTLEKTVFRSDHASNYLALKGILNRDKSALLKQLSLAITQPNQIPLREEWQRGL